MGIPGDLESLALESIGEISLLAADLGIGVTARRLGAAAAGEVESGDGFGLLTAEPDGTAQTVAARAEEF